MSRKTTKKRGRRPSSKGTDWVGEIRKATRSQNYAHAYDTAKLGSRLSGDESITRLRIEVGIKYASELVEASESDCRVVLRELIEIDELDDEGRHQVASIMVQVNMHGEAIALVGEDGIESIKMDEATVASIVDTAVTDSALLPSMLDQYREQVAAVRDALTAVEVGDDETALELLKCIPRRSPLAEWRLLVRGLVAYYDSDDEHARASWDKLASDRLPIQIARPLRALMGDGDPRQVSPSTRKGMMEIERDVWDHPYLTTLLQIRRVITEDNMESLAEPIRVLSKCGNAAENPVSLRLTQILYPMLIQRFSDIPTSSPRVSASGMNILDRILDALTPLPDDPNWYRLRALGYEDNDNDLAVSYWTDYIEDIKSPDSPWHELDRRIAVSMVSHRISSLYAQYLAHDIITNIGTGDPADPMSGRNAYIHDRAVELLLAAVEAWPMNLAAQEELASFYKLAGDEAAYLDRLIEMVDLVPENCEWQSLLGKESLRALDGDRAVQCFEAIHQLQPLNQAYAELLFESYLAKSITRTNKEDYPAAQKAIENAGKLQPNFAESSDAYVRLAIIRSKLLPSDESQKLVHLAYDCQDKVVVKLQLAIYSSLYGLETQQQNVYLSDLETSLKSGTKRVSAAARMAAVLIPVLKMNDNPVVITSAIKHANTYILKAVRRCKDATDPGVKTVLSFLTAMVMTVADTPSQHVRTIQSLAKLLVKQYPDDAVVHFALGLSTLMNADPDRGADLGEANNELKIALSLIDEDTATNEELGLIPLIETAREAIAARLASPSGSSVHDKINQTLSEMVTNYHRTGRELSAEEIAELAAGIIEDEFGVDVREFADQLGMQM